MIRLSLLALTCFTLAGCLNWQGTYDSAARSDCREIINPEARQDCLTDVQRNASERNAERRS
jgi:hypothetical protein